MPLLVTIGAFIPGLFGKSISAKAAKVFGIVVIVLFLIAALGLAKYAYDASVVAEHVAKQRAERAEKQREADHKADAELREQNKALAETQKQLEDAQAAAARKDPEGAAKPVGPVTESYYDTLRNRKEKR